MYGTTIIARSNAAIEDIELRGAYTSYPVQGTMDGAIAAVGMVLEQGADVLMAVILQPLVSPSWAGHMSNERRLARSTDTWLIEGLTEGESSSQHYIRAVTDAATAPLVARTKPMVATALKKVAGRLKALSPFRFHCEWVWNGERVWIVQADSADAASTIAPANDYLRSKDSPGPPFTPTVLKHFKDVDDLAIWRKLRRPGIFSSLGMPTAEVYLLRGDHWMTPSLRGRLVGDFTAMCSHPVVVRCDVAESANSDETLLPTSSATTKVEDLITFCDATASDLQSKGLKDVDWAFLLARLVPARASAMVHARPGSKRVQVDSLWGFPDGLLHFPHDSSFFYPGAKQVKKFVRYKGTCLLPKGSAWEPCRVDAPHDWQPVLSDIEITTLADWARRLADKVDREVQLMALARIGGQRGPSACLPWHYTDWAVPTFEQSMLTLPLLPKLGIIGSTEDLRRFREGALKDIAAYLIRPRAEFLRDTTFLQASAELAASQKKPIYFEGSLLGHAYYLMRHTGATVIPVSPVEPRGDRRMYHKLVRDRIPVIIQETGGIARVRQLPRSDALQLLKQKLIEEALEVWGADQTTIAEELSDVLEVIEALRKQSQIERDELERVQREKRNKRGGFDQLIYLEETGIQSLQASDGDGIIPLFADAPEHRLKSSPKTSNRIEVLPTAGVADILRFRVPLVPPVSQQGTGVLALKMKEHEIEVTYSTSKLTIYIKTPQERDTSKQLSLFPDIGEENSATTKQ
jgi:predicted house-cleaning noncanonical NTP pyrophosphatase (MazG superfamily)